jgi:VanZ family protein
LRRVDRAGRVRSGNEVRLRPETERKITAWVPAIAYTGLIFGVSSISGMSPPIPSFALSDKLAHVVEFAGLGLFLTVAFRGSLPERRRARTPIFVIAIGLAVGALDEAYQLSVPGRAVEFFDWVGDGIGVVIGAAVGMLHGPITARMRPNERRETTDGENDEA